MVAYRLWTLGKDKYDEVSVTDTFVHPVEKMGKNNTVGCYWLSLGVEFREIILRATFPEVICGYSLSG